MSFNCQKCGKHQPQGSAPIKTVVEWRTITDESGRVRNDIKRELDICASCAGIVALKASQVDMSVSSTTEVEASSKQST